MDADQNQSNNNNEENYEGDFCEPIEEQLYNNQNDMNNSELLSLIQIENEINKNIVEQLMLFNIFKEKNDSLLKRNYNCLFFENYYKEYFIVNSKWLQNYLELYNFKKISKLIKKQSNGELKVDDLYKKIQEKQIFMDPGKKIENIGYERIYKLRWIDFSPKQEEIPKEIHYDEISEETIKFFNDFSIVNKEIYKKIRRDDNKGYNFNIENKINICLVDNLFIYKIYDNILGFGILPDLEDKTEIFNFKIKFLLILYDEEGCDLNDEISEIIKKTDLEKYLLESRRVDFSTSNKIDIYKDNKKIGFLYNIGNFKLEDYWGRNKEKKMEKEKELEKQKEEERQQELEMQRKIQREKEKKEIEALKEIERKKEIKNELEKKKRKENENRLLNQIEVELKRKEENERLKTEIENQKKLKNIKNTQKFNSNFDYLNINNIDMNEREKTEEIEEIEEKIEIEEDKKTLIKLRKERNNIDDIDFKLRTYSNFKFDKMKLFPKNHKRKSLKISINNSDNFNLPNINFKRPSLKTEKSLYIENNNKLNNFKSVFDDLGDISGKEKTYNNLDDCQFNSNKINNNFKNESKTIKKEKIIDNNKEIFESHDFNISNKIIINQNGLIKSETLLELNKKTKFSKTMYYIKKGIKNSVELPNIEKINNDKNNKKMQKEPIKENNYKKIKFIEPKNKNERKNWEQKDQFYKTLREKEKSKDNIFQQIQQQKKLEEEFRKAQEKEKKRYEERKKREEEKERKRIEDLEEKKIHEEEVYQRKIENDRYESDLKRKKWEMKTLYQEKRNKIKDNMWIKKK